ncbi:MAG: hypothetical protein C4321_02055 [Chloroflexota bacterium]
MGWLFALALGLQQRSGRAIGVALVPIALGHAASLALVALAVGLLGPLVPLRALGLGAGLALIAHEARHIGQVREMGRLRFYIRYLSGQLRCRFRHDRHPLEIPCIQLQRTVRASLRQRGFPG